MRMRGKTVERETEHRVDRARASCGGEGESIALFFSDQLDAIARAKAVCRGCDQLEPCLQGALARREPCGVWGGELFANGLVLAHKRPRGRPRKDHRVPLTA